MRTPRTPDRAEERAWIKAARSGDREAFRALYLATVDEVHQYLVRRVPSDDAQELTAEVFCRAWEAMPRYEPGPVPFAGWLVRIASNLVISRGRRRQVLTFDAPMPAEQASAGFEDRVVAQLDGVVLRQALEALASAQREVVERRFLQERTVREVAETMGISEEGVRSLTYRALRSLRAEVLREGGRPSTAVS